jgi:tetratricopeptide (TPR) repeat protein
MSELTRSLTGCLSVLALLGASAMAQAEAKVEPTCVRLDRSEGLNDYRMHTSSKELQWAIQDGVRNHLDPARKRLRAGEFTEYTLADIVFILRHWPNHLPALQALIDYDLGGGRPYGYEATECYFEHALEFAPDDRNVILAKAYWRLKKGDRKTALSLYQDVLELDPESADAHYNLGLLYFDMSDFPKARDHAKAAYEAGFPLPGLRKKLERAGQWDTPPTAQAKPTAELK